MNKKDVWLVAAVVIVGVGWYLLSGQAGRGTAGANDPVATVNGTAITRGQLTAAEMQIAVQQGMAATSTSVRAQFQPDALNFLIGQTLIEQAAVQAGITASSTQVGTRLAAAKAQFSTPNEYEQALAAQGMTEDEFRTQISQNLVINAYLDQKLSLSTATATPTEIRTAYNQAVAQHPGSNTPPLSQVRDQVAHMVVQQKQQNSISAYVTKLRSAADIRILIATSTPAV